MQCGMARRSQTFSTIRQQASAAALALSLTLAMLLSVNLLATQPTADAQMAGVAASSAQSAQQTHRAPRV